MNISIRHIQHFVAVAQELHFRRAAELANVAQPALSRSVQTLENELGVQLLERNNRNVRLTAAGKEFLAGCTDIIDAMDTSINKTIRASQTEFGGINVGYTYIAMCGILPKLLTDFEAKYPAIAIEPYGIPSIDQLERLHHNELDFCFLTGPIGVQDANTSVFQRDAFIVIVNDNSRFADRTSISIEELSREKIMLRTNEKASSFNQHVFDFFNVAGITPNVEFVDQDHVGLLGSVALDRGVCIATEGYNCVYKDNVKTLKLTGTAATLPTIMIWRKDVDSKSITTFREFILDGAIRRDAAAASVVAQSTLAQNAPPTPTKTPEPS